jgi:hypothetical protein
MAESMLEEVRVDYEEALQSARLNDDADAIAEYSALLLQLKPLPVRDVAVDDDSDRADFKKWLDPNSLR